MTEEQKIRKELEETCAKRGKKAEISKDFNISRSTVTRWLEGGEIPPPMLKLLAWYLFGILPPRLSGISPNIKGMMEFDEAEWQVIQILANRAGNQTPAQWIAARVRAYLESQDKAHDVRAALRETPAKEA